MVVWTEFPTGKRIHPETAALLLSLLHLVSIRSCWGCKGFPQRTPPLWFFFFLGWSLSTVSVHYLQVLIKTKFLLHSDKLKQKKPKKKTRKEKGTSKLKMGMDIMVNLKAFGSSVQCTSTLMAKPHPLEFWLLDEQWAMGLNLLLFSQQYFPTWPLERH